MHSIFQNQTTSMPFQLPLSYTAEPWTPFEIQPWTFWVFFVYFERLCVIVNFKFGLDLAAPSFALNACKIARYDCSLGSFKYTTSRWLPVYSCKLHSCVLFGQAVGSTVSLKAAKEEQRKKGRDLYGLSVDVCIYIYVYIYICRILIRLEKYFKIVQ